MPDFEDEADRPSDVEFDPTEVPKPGPIPRPDPTPTFPPPAPTINRASDFAMQRTRWGEPAAPVIEPPPPPALPVLPPLGRGDIHDRISALEQHIKALWEAQK